MKLSIRRNEPRVLISFCRTVTKIPEWTTWRERFMVWGISWHPLSAVQLGRLSWPWEHMAEECSPGGEQDAEKEGPGGRVLTSKRCPLHLLLPSISHLWKFPQTVLPPEHQTFEDIAYSNTILVIGPWPWDRAKASWSDSSVKWQNLLWGNKDTPGRGCPRES